MQGVQGPAHEGRDERGGLEQADAAALSGERQQSTGSIQDAAGESLRLILLMHNLH